MGILRRGSWLVAVFVCSAGLLWAESSRVNPRLKMIKRLHVGNTGVKEEGGEEVRKKLIARIASSGRFTYVDSLDRADADRFAVTKEFLAQLLGTNRPTVSVLVSALEQAGILNMKGRWVTLADRNRLEEAACECYDVIRKTYEAVV